MNDDSGSCAVLSEHGSSVTHMTASKVLDVISRLPGCAGQASECSIGWKNKENGRRAKVVEITRIRVHNCLDSSTRSRRPKS